MHRNIVLEPIRNLQERQPPVRVVPTKIYASSNVPKGPDPALPFIRDRMLNVKRKILIMSGKGGVGKSTFCAQLGWAFAADDATQVRICHTKGAKPLQIICSP